MATVSRPILLEESITLYNFNLFFVSFKYVLRCATQLWGAEVQIAEFGIGLGTGPWTLAGILHLGTFHTSLPCTGRGLFCALEPIKVGPLLWGVLLEIDVMGLGYYN